MDHHIWLDDPSILSGSAAERLMGPRDPGLCLPLSRALSAPHARDTVHITMLNDLSWLVRTHARKRGLGLQQLEWRAH